MAIDPTVEELVSSTTPTTRYRMFPPQKVQGGLAPLLPCRDAWGAIIEPFLWATRAGLDVQTKVPLEDGSVAELLSPNWVSSIFLPLAPTDEYGPRRWPGCDPRELMWPWMWLPPRLARPRLWDVEDGSQMEPLHVWQTRVTLELSAAGLFDPQMGWVDVLSHGAGLDIANVGDQSRLRAWMSGTVDKELDLIGPNFVEEFLSEDPEDPVWAMVEALKLSDIPVHDDDAAGPLFLYGVGNAAGSLMMILDSYEETPIDPDSDQQPQELGIHDVAKVVDFGLGLPGQTAQALQSWQEAQDRLDTPGIEPWEVSLVVGNIHTLLEPLIEAALSVQEFIDDYFGETQAPAPAITPRHALEEKPTKGK